MNRLMITGPGQAVFEDVPMPECAAVSAGSESKLSESISDEEGASTNIMRVAHGPSGSGGPWP